MKTKKTPIPVFAYLAVKAKRRQGREFYKLRDTTLFFLLLTRTELNQFSDFDIFTAVSGVSRER